MNKKEIVIPVVDVEYLNNDIIDAEKQIILDSVFEEKKSIFNRLKEIYLGPGFKCIYYKCEYSWLIGIMAYLVIMRYCISVQNSINYHEFLSLMVAPILYITFYIVSFWSEEQIHVIELKKSMKYSHTYIVSLRMFWTSIVCVLVNIGTLGMFSEIKIWEVGAISITSIILFSIVSLFCYQKWGNYYHIIPLVAIWLIVCEQSLIDGKQLHKFLFEVIPLSVHVIIAFSCMIAYIGFIRKVELKNAYTCKCNKRLWEI